MARRSPIPNRKPQVSQFTKKYLQEIALLLEEGISFHKLGNLNDAKIIYEKILSKDKNNFNALQLLATVNSQQKNYDIALKYYELALSIDRANSVVLNNRGNVLQELKRFDEALSSYDGALRIKPNYAEALYNRGNVLKELKQFDAALSSYERAIRIAPDYVEALTNKGNTLQYFKRFDEALRCYEDALRIKPNCAEAFFNRGNILQNLKRYVEALNSYKEALHIRPDYAEAFEGNGNTLKELGHLSESLESYSKALEINPDFNFLVGKIQHIKMFLCDWKSFDLILEALENSLLNERLISSPFPLLSLIDSPSLQKKCAKIFINKEHPIQQELLIGESQRRDQKIKIGYFSSDFGNHPVSHLIAGLLEKHDRIRFEIIAFSLSNEEPDAWQHRIMQSVDQFIDVSKNSDWEVAKLARSLEIDIAIDLNGHTAKARPGIFAIRTAPIQASYIGFLGTMGASYFDYLIADPILIPEDSRECYTEKIVYLPFYQCNDDKCLISEKNFTRKEFGLPEDAFIFCSFNNNWKITPPVFDSWMRILSQVPKSVLWVYVDNQTAKESLCKEAIMRGINSNRLIFASKIPLEEHLARQRLADLFLDTFPYNAGATGSNALRVGLPLITRSGNSFASRYSASLLIAVGLQELITNTTEEFELLAVELATCPNLLLSVKEKLLNNVIKYPLFNTTIFARNIESAFIAMYQRAQDQLPPSHIFVSDRY